MSEDKNSLSISNSILVGSVIIALSIFISVNGEGSFFSSTAKGSSAVKKSGTVEIIEYSDFQCPFCKKFHEDTYPSLKKNYIDTGKVTFVYKHLPLSIHKNAQKAAEASECAKDQGKFWEYHDLLFKNGNTDGSGLELTDLKRYATDLGLNPAKFNTCLDSGEKAPIVKKDVDEAVALGVSGTPTFYINGRQVVGAQPFSSFETIINSL